MFPKYHHWAMFYTVGGLIRRPQPGDGLCIGRVCMTVKRPGGEWSYKGSGEAAR